MFPWVHDMRRCVGKQGSRTVRCFATTSQSHKQLHLPQDAGTNIDLGGAGSEVASKALNDSNIPAISNRNVMASITRSPKPNLPLSPLMDPIYLAAKQKHRLPKAPPSKNPTPFQQQLAKNPFARALSTPVRMCSLTRTWLPSFFLQDFELIKHPTTGDPWYLPRSLTSTNKSPRLNTLHGDIPPLSEARRLGPKAFVLSQKRLVEGIHTKQGGFFHGYKRFPSNRLKDSKQFPENKIRFRADADTFILELMRRRTVEELVHVSSLEKGYIVPCGYEKENDLSPIDCAKGKKNVGAILWMGKSTAAATMDDMPEPGEFATVGLPNGRREKMPVHNLKTLLGEKHLTDLRNKTQGKFGTEVVVLRTKRVTINVQLRLWKLQGYRATYEGLGNTL